MRGLNFLSWFFSCHVLYLRFYDRKSHGRRPGAEFGGTKKFFSGPISGKISIFMVKISDDFFSVIDLLVLQIFPFFSHNAWAVPTSNFWGTVPPYSACAQSPLGLRPCIGPTQAAGLHRRQAYNQFDISASGIGFDLNTRLLRPGLVESTCRAHMRCK